jgi:quercetin dioxygenase-like cupin family protein
MIRTPQVTVLRLEFRKGAIVPRHDHFHEQVTMLTAGLSRLVVSGEEVTLRPGDVLRIPPHAPHFTEALEDSNTVEMFAPARDDLKCADEASLG